MRFPNASLLPKYVPLTLAQRGAAAIEDAIGHIKELHYVIHSRDFTESPYQPLRDQRKFEETRNTLDALLAHMEEAAKSLTLEGVFLPKNSEDACVLPRFVQPLAHCVQLARELPVDDVEADNGVITFID